MDRTEAKRRQLRAAELWDMELEVRVAGRDFVLIPPGEFIMGSPTGEAGRDEGETPHRVRITRPFYIARDEEPFEMQGWPDNLSALFAQAPAGYGFRLPTEAEWEYAARAGVASSHHGAGGDAARRARPARDARRLAYRAAGYVWPA